MADWFDEQGMFAMAVIARKYAVDRPRWWHGISPLLDANGAPYTFEQDFDR
jgi:hypothetical protein